MCKKVCAFDLSALCIHNIAIPNLRHLQLSACCVCITNAPTAIHCVQEVQVLWEGYKETYAMLEPMRQALAEYIQEKNAGHKRKLAELQSEGERLMADAER